MNISGPRTTITGITGLEGVILQVTGYHTVRHEYKITVSAPTGGVSDYDTRKLVVAALLDRLPSVTAAHTHPISDHIHVKTGGSGFSFYSNAAELSADIKTHLTDNTSA